MSSKIIWCGQAQHAKLFQNNCACAFRFRGPRRISLVGHPSQPEKGPGDSVPGRLLPRPLPRAPDTPPAGPYRREGMERRARGRARGRQGTEGDIPVQNLGPGRNTKKKKRKRKRRGKRVRKPGARTCHQKLRGTKRLKKEDAEREPVDTRPSLLYQSATEAPTGRHAAPHARRAPSRRSGALRAIEP